MSDIRETFEQVGVTLPKGEVKEGVVELAISPDRKSRWILEQNTRWLYLEKSVPGENGIWGFWSPVVGVKRAEENDPSLVVVQFIPRSEWGREKTGFAFYVQGSRTSSHLDQTIIPSSEKEALYPDLSLPESIDQEGTLREIARRINEGIFDPRVLVPASP